MNLGSPQHYKVTYTAETKQILCEHGTPHFAGNAASNMPKLYVFSRNRLPLYVGATVSPMGTRLRSGWKAAGKGGYHGYAFRHEGTEVDLDVWTDLDPVRKRPPELRSGSDIETIEAEIVYLIRQRTNQWPRYQTEIHFYQSDANHRSEAEKVMGHYGLSGS